MHVMHTFVERIYDFYVLSWKCYFYAFVQMNWRFYNSAMVAHRVRLMFCEHAVFWDTDLPTFRPTCRSTNSPTDMFKAIYLPIFEGKLDLPCGICS